MELVVFRDQRERLDALEDVLESEGETGMGGVGSCWASEDRLELEEKTMGVVGKNDYITFNRHPRPSLSRPFGFTS